MARKSFDPAKEPEKRKFESYPQSVRDYKENDRYGFENFNPPAYLKIKAIATRWRKPIKETLAILDEHCFKPYGVIHFESREINRPVPAFAALSHSLPLHRVHNAAKRDRSRLQMHQIGRVITVIPEAVVEKIERELGLLR